MAEKGHAQSFTILDICRYPSLRTDFIKVSFAFTISLLLEFGPVLLESNLLPNIFLPGFANGISLLLAIPFMPYLNEKASRRYSNMIFNGLIALFLLLQFLVNPTGCISCLSGANYIIILVLFFISRFFANMFANFILNSLNECFPSQVRAITSSSIGCVARLISLVIPYIPKFLLLTGVPYSIFFVFVAILGIISSFLLR